MTYQEHETFTSPPPTPLSLGSARQQLTHPDTTHKYLIDENVDVSLLSVLKDAGAQLCSVHESHLTGAPDKLVFSYAARHKLPIITTDCDFLDFPVFDYPNSKGTIVVFQPKRDMRLRELILKAQHHFLTFPQGMMNEQNGTVVSYRKDGTFIILRPDTTDRRNARHVMRGTFANLSPA